MKVVSHPLELRGIANKVTQAGNVYYTVNLEEADGTPVALFAKNADGFAPGLRKGDTVVATCEYVKYDRQERIVCVALDKVEE
jgi:predicted alternative tryptophan synthase beta-subunit